MAYEHNSGFFAGFNARLDQLPRTQFFFGGRKVPAFRGLAVFGYYLAVLLGLLTALLSGLSLLAALGLAAVCALSFFAWAYVRRALSGHEELVLLEHLWFALLCCTLFGVAAELSLPNYLDLISAPVALFLAAGRLGCLTVGCCHGVPASVGIVYPEDIPLAQESSRWRIGIRLLPVPALEAAALMAIALGALLLLILGPPGSALAWFLCSYAVVRFGIEGLRGDKRPHLFGLSQARWMSLVQLLAALVWAQSALAAVDTPRTALISIGVLALSAVIATIFARPESVYTQEQTKELGEAMHAMPSLSTD